MLRLVKGSVIGAAILGFSGAALALPTEGEVRCPESGSLPDIRIFYSSPSPGASCWDWGPSNISESGKDIGPMPIALGDDKLQLPSGVNFITSVNQAVGSEGGLTMTYDSDTQSGTWTVAPGTVYGSFFYLLLKAGGGNINPVWAAFKIPTSAASGTFTIQDERGGGLSHSAIYGTVPLPAAAWLLISGMLGLFGISRRRRSGTAAA